MAHIPRTPRKLRKPRGDKPDFSVGSEPMPTFKSELVPVEVYHSAGPTSVKTSSSSVRRRQLEMEAEAAKARLQIEAAEANAQAAAARARAEAAQVKANITADLIEKQLAADVAELESKRSNASSIISNTNQKVNNWLNKTAEQVHAPNPDKQMSRVDKQDVLLTRLAISKDLPSYSGDPMEWLQFKESYLESTRLCRYSAAENVWRLRKCLKGDAKEAVSALLIGGTTPDIILDTLELRFGTPESIIDKITSQLRRIQPLALHGFQHELIPFAIKIKNCVAAAKALKQQDYLRGPELFAIVVTKLPAVLMSKWIDYYNEKWCSTNDLPKLEMLGEFLYYEANKAARSGVSHIHPQNQKKDVHPTSQRAQKSSHNILLATSSAASQSECRFCRKMGHEVPSCPRFKRAMRKDRWRCARTANLCYKCLAPRHQDSECPASNCDIEGCNQPHHRLLHWVKPGRKKSDEKVANEHAEVQTSETVNHAVASLHPEVLLKVVPLTVHGPAGAVHTHALLDDGATVTLIAAGLADELGLTGEPERIRVRSAWDNSEITCETQILNIKVSNSEGENYSVRARKINELNLPVQVKPEIDLSKYGLGSDFDYKNNLCNCNIKPALLIGQDNHKLIVPVNCYISEESEPYVTQTALGWCVHGSLVSDVTFNSKTISSRDCCDVENIFHCYPSVCTPNEPHEPVLKSCCNAARHLDELHEDVRKSFLLDSIGVSTQPRRSSDDVRAITILDQTAELRDGRWYVGLPWKSDSPCMPDSYPNAIRRLKSVKKKLLASSDYAIRYHERMHHLFANDYAKELGTIQNGSVGNNERVWYLPHFGVDNPNKRKLRLVFDAAAKSNNRSLNDFLLQGPDLLQSLLGIMLRFRENPVGIIGDIQDMFLRIKIRNEDIHALRFLWQDKFLSSGGPPQALTPPQWVRRHLKMA